MYIMYRPKKKNNKYFPCMHMNYFLLNYTLIELIGANIFKPVHSLRHEPQPVLKYLVQCQYGANKSNITKWLAIFLLYSLCIAAFPH